MAIFSKVLVLLVVTLVSVAAQADTGRGLGDFQVGINCHQLYPSNLPLLNDLGVRSARIDIFWNEVADRNGVLFTPLRALDRSLDAPLSLSGSLGILCYGHGDVRSGARPTDAETRQAFAEYCSNVVKQLRHKISFFEVWNEWNVVGMGNTPISEGRGNPDDYVSLLALAYKRIKDANPEAFVLGGAMGGIGEIEDFLPRALSAGLLEHCDGLSVHPYFFGAPTRKDRLPENALPERISRLKAWLSEYPDGDETPIYVTELGWPTYEHQEGVSQEEQARNMVRSILVLALEPRVKGVWLYELRDSGTDTQEREHAYGLVERDGAPKASYYALKDTVSLLSKAKSIERLPSCKDCFAVALVGDCGARTYIAWAVDEDKSCSIEVEGKGATKKPILRALGSFEFQEGDVLNPGSRKDLGVMPLVLTDVDEKLALRITAADE